jgi:hypothetical protein
MDKNEERVRNTTLVQLWNVISPVSIRSRSTISALDAKTQRAPEPQLRSAKLYRDRARQMEAMAKHLLAPEPGSAQKPGDSSERLDNPPVWSPWNFQSKQRDWHEVIYDEMHRVHEA